MQGLKHWWNPRLVRLRRFSVAFGTFKIVLESSGKLKQF